MNERRHSRGRALGLGVVAAAAAACGLCLPTTVAAQGAPAPIVSPAMDAAVSRARVLLDRGEGAEARTVLDSLVTAAPAGSNDLAEALFWRASLSERMADAERDWKRLTIETPLSPRAADALVRLGELEMLRTRYADARTYFERVVREFPTGTLRVRSQLWIARSYAAQRELPRACVTLVEAQNAGLPDGELRLQAEELGRQCATVDPKLIAKAGAAGTAGTAPATTAPATTAPAGNTPATTAPATTAPAGTAPAGTAPAGTAPAGTAPAGTAPVTTAPGGTARRGARYSVQLAAYDTRAEAEAAVKRLVSRKIEARVDGEVKPFRVRTGYYATRAEATAALATFKKQGQAGFVAEITP